MLKKPIRQGPPSLQICGCLITPKHLGYFSKASLNGLKQLTFNG
jgi:hypothetical protein